MKEVKNVEHCEYYMGIAVPNFNAEWQRCDAETTMEFGKVCWMKGVDDGIKDAVKMRELREAYLLERVEKHGCTIKDRDYTIACRNETIKELNEKVSNLALEIEDLNYAKYTAETLWHQQENIIADREGRIAALDSLTDAYEETISELNQDVERWRNFAKALDSERIQLNNKANEASESHKDVVERCRSYARSQEDEVVELKKKLMQADADFAKAALQVDQIKSETANYYRDLYSEANDRKITELKDGLNTYGTLLGDKDEKITELKNALSDSHIAYERQIGSNISLSGALVEKQQEVKKLNEKLEQRDNLEEHIAALEGVIQNLNRLASWLDRPTVTPAPGIGPNDYPIGGRNPITCGSGPVFGHTRKTTDVSSATDVANECRV